jgi:hypothetical protein
MLTVNDKNHTSLVIGSIERIYNRSKIYGKLKIKNLYFIDIIANLLSGKCITLTSEQTNGLLSIYYATTFQSSEICRPTICKMYQSTARPAFIQAETEDCNDAPLNSSIYYWQEPYILNDESIYNLAIGTGYMQGKSSDTYENFEKGKYITYSDIGKVTFFAFNSNNFDFVITDILNNDVTHAFNLTYVPKLNATLFISNNIYSHGIMFFKFKKLNTKTTSKIFSNQFNNTFK